MKQTSGNFNGINGKRLYYETWLPEGSSKATLVIVHGAGEHIRRYGNLVNGLGKSGYALVGYDQRGHGRSEGRRGHINAWEEYRGDLQAFIKQAGQILPDKPKFVLGHSLGSLIVLDYIMYNPQGLSGAILSGTALEPVDAAPPVKKFLAKVLSGIYPAFSMKAPLPGKSLSRDAGVAKAYDEDPMVFWDRTARWGAECLKAITRIKTNPHKIRMPVLFIHGEKDPLVAAEGAQRYFDRLKDVDKTIRIYQGNLHETLNDLDYPEVIAELESWLSKHL